MLDGVLISRFHSKKFLQIESGSTQSKEANLLVDSTNLTMSAEV